MTRRLQKHGFLPGGCCYLLLLFGCAADHVIGSAGLLTTPAPLYAAGTDAAAVTTADFDGDGLVDVAAIDAAGQTLCILAGQGDGTLAAPSCQSPALGFTVSMLAAVRRGLSTPADLIAAGTALVLVAGPADHGFTPAPSISLNNGGSFFTTADVNGDGIDDVLLSDRDTPTLSIWPLAADGKLGPPLKYQLSQPQRSLLYQDLDGDGRPELVGLGPSAVTVYGARGAIFSPACPPGPGGTAFGAPALVGGTDTDGDGLTDLVVADAARAGLAVLRGSSSLSFDCGDGELLSPLTQPAALLSADFDHDGSLDLLALGGAAPDLAAPGAAVLLLGGAAAAVTRYPLPGPAVAGALGDLNGDGRLDVVVALSGGSIAVFDNGFLLP